jgi:hypothetical protein
MLRESLSCKDTTISKYEDAILRYESEFKELKRKLVEYESRTDRISDLLHEVRLYKSTIDKLKLEIAGHEGRIRGERICGHECYVCEHSYRYDWVTHCKLNAQCSSFSVKMETPNEHPAHNPSLIVSPRSVFTP